MKRKPTRPNQQSDIADICKLRMMDTEEAVKVKAANQPIMPGVDGVRSHQSTNQPYRDGCRHCVRGKSDDVRHGEIDGKRIHPVISLDHMYSAKKGEQNNQVFVGHGDQSSSIVGLVVPSKGGMISIFKRAVQWMN